MKLSCDGCKHKGKYENEVETGMNSPCTTCQRRCSDNFESSDMDQFRNVLNEANIEWSEDIMKINSGNAKYISLYIEDKGQIDINFTEDEKFDSVQFIG